MYIPNILLSVSSLFIFISKFVTACFATEKIDDELLENISSKDLEKNLINTVNDALNNAEKSSKQIMSEMTGGLNIPGL